jgi:hypothetical protein
MRFRSQSSLISEFNHFGIRRHFCFGLKYVYQFGVRLKYFKSGGGWSFFMGMMVPSALRK